MPWPGTAAVTVSLVHAAHGYADRHVRPILGGTAAPAINSRLRPKPERPEPGPLAANANSSYQGSIVVGMGFTLTPTERDSLVNKSPRNAERIFPYLGGEEINTSPTQEFERHVISFGDMPLEDAERWPDLIRVIREKVKPERDKVKREAHRIYWWHFGDKRPALYTALATLNRCLVVSRHSKHLAFAFQPTGRIFSEATYVFPLDRDSPFATLQSRIHEPWARLLSSSLEDRLRYSASDCFETFPFPHPDPRTVLPELESIASWSTPTRASRRRTTP
jgi:hypothetical protein